jgi:uncharacterized beta-barrel protein YwiB (DUF1934 family)
MSEKKEIRIHIESINFEVEASLFGLDDDDETMLSEEDIADSIEPERTEMKTFGTFSIGEDGRAEICYEETDETGMEGSKTSVSFDIDQPGIVTMMRTGAVSTALIFEKDKRHHCVYNTPYMPFEVCVKTIDVKNRIFELGHLELDYIVEIRGAKAERTKLYMKIKG